MNGIDLGQLDSIAASNQGAVLQVLHPATNLPIGVEITLAGADSDIFQQAQNAWANKQRNRFMKQRGNPAALMPSAEETRERSLELVARCSLSWKGVVYQGQELACNYDNALMLYKALPWLREQVDEFINDRANFLAS